MVSLNPMSWYRKWPIKLIIREQRGNGFRLDYDKGARIKNSKTGVDEIVFESVKRRHQSFQAPPYEQYTPSAGGESTIELLSPSSGVYVPINIQPDPSGLSLNIADTNVNEWASLKRREAREMFKTKEPWWMTIMPYLMIMVVAASIAVFGILMFDKMPQLLGQMQSIADKMLEIAQVQSGQVFATGTIPAPPKVG